MRRKTKLQYIKPGDVAGLERQLDAMSGAGWQIVTPGRFCQRYVFDDKAVYRHRVGYCAARQGSADEISYLAAQARDGWHPAARKRGWMLFRTASEEAEFTGGAPVAQKLRAQVKVIEGIRMWVLLLAALLLVSGYASSLLPVLYASVLPLGIMIVLTLCIKYLERGANDDRLL